MRFSFACPVRRHGQPAWCLAASLLLLLTGAAAAPRSTRAGGHEYLSFQVDQKPASSQGLERDGGAVTHLEFGPDSMGFRCSVEVVNYPRKKMPDSPLKARDLLRERRKPACAEAESLLSHHDHSILYSVRAHDCPAGQAGKISFTRILYGKRNVFALEYTPSRAVDPTGASDPWVQALAAASIVTD